MAGFENRGETKAPSVKPDHWRKDKGHQGFRGREGEVYSPCPVKYSMAAIRNSSGNMPRYPISCKIAEGARSVRAATRSKSWEDLPQKARLKSPESRSKQLKNSVGWE